MTGSGAAGATSGYCPWCGGVPVAPDDPAHAICRRRLATVDPPRYCPACARRMVVQVDPMGWTARCSRHGETTSASDPGRALR